MVDGAVCKIANVSSILTRFSNCLNKLVVDDLLGTKAAVVRFYFEAPLRLTAEHGCKRLSGPREAMLTHFSPGRLS